MEPGPASVTRFCGYAIVQVATVQESRFETHVGFEETQIISPSQSSTDRSPENDKKSQTIQDIKFLWQTEDIGIDDEATNLKEEEDDFNNSLIENHKNSTYRNKNGRYVIRLQFKDNILSLKDNRGGGSLHRDFTPYWRSYRRIQPNCQQLTPRSRSTSRLVSSNQQNPDAPVNLLIIYQSRRCSNRTPVHPCKLRRE